jgi:hypothetical protein
MGDKRFRGEATLSEHSNSVEYKLKLTIRVPGPLRPRRKYKEYELLTAEGTTTLPFVPYPGLYLRFSKPNPKKKDPFELQLRIRTVEWLITERIFECVADETFASAHSMELDEVRGSPRFEKHFAQLQKTFALMGFDVTTDMDGYLWTLHKTAGGEEIGSRHDYF